jgi:hypothetical protein
MKAILNVLIFCLVLFIYIHVYFHVKCCNDLEVYEIEQPSKDKLEEICDMRQPVIFDYPNEDLLSSCTQETMKKMYGAFEVKIRNLHIKQEDDEELYIPLSLNQAHNAINKDTDRKYLVEKNCDFLDETAINKIFKSNDTFIRPYMVSNCIYDFMIANKGVQTPFRYELNYRNFFLVTEGDARIKLAPPKSTKYLNQTVDYENFEFSSPINPWKVDGKYANDFEKIKCLEITLKRGSMIYIPAYWWYSIEFGENTTVVAFKYRTFMNNVAILPKLVMRLLQNQNVKRQIAPLMKKELS